MGKKEQTLRFVPRNMAPPNDSLRVWSKVTQFIVNDDMKKADLAKVKVEENARKLRKQRDVTGEELKGNRWVHTAAAEAPVDSAQQGSHNSTMEDTEWSVTTFQTKTDMSESEDCKS